MLRSLGIRLGQGLAFADDVSERQLRTIGSPSTRTALVANARSFIIGAIRKSPLPGAELIEHHTALNKVLLVDSPSRQHFWLKSEAAVAFTFLKPGDQLFPYPSSIDVLTFTVLATEVEFRHAPITIVRKRLYRLEAELESLGRFPLGGVIPPGGYPTERASGIFDAGHTDSFEDLFDDGEQGGEASA